MVELLQLGDAVQLGEHLGVLWNAVLPEQIAGLVQQRLTLYTLAHGATASTSTETAAVSPPTDGAAFHCGRWDPHHAHSLGLGVGSSLVTIDTRTMKWGHSVADAHSQSLRCIDYNPNKPYVALTAGDDYAMRYWDLRKPGTPLFAVKSHAHWVTGALYNRFHDQASRVAGG
jgi:WD40 repeat protein